MVEPPYISSPHWGFTLIEIIATLVLVGIMAALGSLGLERIVQGYTLSKDNAELAEKAQLAFSRMAIEFSHVDQNESQSGSTTSFTYKAYFDDSLETSTITWNAGSKLLTLTKDGSVHTLTDMVTNFRFAYFQSFDDTTPDTSFFNDVSKIIGITLEMTGTNNVPQTFTTRITLPAVD